MKIALCLYGQIREFDLVYSTLYQRLLIPYNPTIYGFVWCGVPQASVNRYDKHHPAWEIYYKTKIPTINITNQYAEDVLYKIRARAGCVQNYNNSTQYQQAVDSVSDITSKWWMPDATYKNWWAQSQCFKLMESDNVDYDLIILSRWDMFYTGHVDLNVDTNVVSIPESCMTSRPNDFWACGNKDVMRIWSSRFDNIANLDPNNLPDEPTKYSIQLLDSNGIPYVVQKEMNLNVLNRQ